MPRPYRSVHPRVCGELRGQTDMLRLWSGSSPRVWGTLISGGIRASAFRFIPACVGNSRCWPNWPGNMTGSSPRVWGTLPHS